MHEKFTRIVTWAAVAALISTLAPAVFADGGPPAGEPQTPGQTIGLDLVTEGKALLAVRQEEISPPDPPGLLNDSRAEHVARLAARLSARHRWLREDVVEALGERALSLDEIFEQAPRFLDIDGAYYRVKLEQDGGAWEDFDPARDPFVVYLTHEVYDLLGKDRALGYRDGEEWILFPGDLETTAAIALTLARITPSEYPDEPNAVIELGMATIALGPARSSILDLPGGIGAESPQLTAKIFCPEVAPTGCSGGRTILCPSSSYDPYLVMTSLRIFDDHEGCCFMGAPEVELYPLRLDTITGSGGASNVTTGMIFDGRTVFDLAGRSRFLPDVDDDKVNGVYKWWNISGGLAVFDATTGTKWGGTLVEDDDTAGKLKVDGGSLNIIDVLDKGHQIIQDVRKNERFELIKDSAGFLDLIADIFSNDDDLFRNSLGVTNDFFCQDVHPNGIFPGTFTLSTTEWELKGYYSCIPRICPICGDGFCGGGSETCTSCPSDCGTCPTGEVCGNNVCESGESCETTGSPGQCQVDCGCCAGWDPVCFVAGTRVTMADGSTRPIEQLQVGDQVLAYDEDDETVVASRVTRTYTHVNMHEEVIVINGSLRATSNHPFYVRGKLVPAGELKVGDVLTTLGKENRGRRSSRGNPPIVPLRGKPETAPLRVKSLERQPPVGSVYNIEVGWQHNYFAEGVLVHNKTSTGGCQSGGGGEEF